MVVYLVWDKKSVYYLIGGVYLILHKSETTHLPLWHAINFVSTIKNQFDSV